MKNFILLCALVLSATAARSEQFVLQPYQLYIPPSRTTVTVQVMWLPPEEVAARCKGGAGCFIGPTNPRHPSLLVLSQPKDFNDHRRLLILGHEFFHALGAAHE